MSALGHESRTGRARAWLASEEPATATQAWAGRLWRPSGALLSHPLGRAGALIVALMLLVAVSSPWLPVADPLAQDLGRRLLPPSAQHLFGTDALGRDVLARVIHGTRASLSVLAIVLLLTVPLGLAIGAAAGLAGGWLDRVLMRITDMFMAFPRLILALAIGAAMGAGLGTAVLAIAVTAWPAYARLVRTEASALRRAEFIDAARSLGASPARLLWRHVVPLCVPSVIVRASLDAPGIVLILAGLGFLGLGLPPPAPEWGSMVADGRAVIFEAWWIAFFPGLAIALLSLGFNLLGDALRDVVDPRTP